MPTWTITLEGLGISYRCPDSRTVLEGMECLGKKGIPVGCRGGGCGVCKVEVLSGEYAAEVMSADHVSADDLAHGRLLACRVRPRSDLQVRVLGSFKRHLTPSSAPAVNLEIPS